MSQDNDKLVAITLNDLEWRRPVRADGPTKGIKYVVFMERLAGAPTVQMTHYDPHWIEPRHRHLEDEVLLLFAGALDVEGELYKAPAAIYVPRGVLYGPLTAGDEGAKFFRVAYEAGTFS